GILSMFADVKALTRGFSRRACGGRMLVAQTTYAIGSTTNGRLRRIMIIQRHPTKSGALYISVHSNHFWAALCELIGRPDLASDPRCVSMRSRAQHAAELVPELRAALAARSAREWEEMFGERVPCAAVRPIEDMFDHPQILAEELVTTLDHPVIGRYRTMTKPIKLSDTPGPAPTASPTFGQHSDELLAGYGHSAAEAATLRGRDVVK